MIKKFGTWDDWKVPITGAAMAGLIALQQFALEPTPDYKAVGLGVGIAIISFIAKSWRGQSLSLAGILGNAAYAFVTVWETGHFTLSQLIIQLVLTFGFAAMPDPKSRGYEQTSTIKDAKIEGEQIKPASLTSTEIKKAAGV